MKRISFYAMYKDFHTGNMEYIDVMPSIYNSLFTSNDKLSKRTLKQYGIKTCQDLKKFINSTFIYYYWSKCEWEFITSDWPPTNREERERKVDIYQQLKPNIELITNLVWEQIKDKLNND